MKAATTLTIYLNRPMRKRAEAGNTNIINRISNAFESRGYRILFRENTAVNLLSSAGDPGYSLFHMEEPFHPHALNLRRVYYYPFWQIESTEARWDWRVAGARFDQSTVDPGQALSFTDYWRKRLFGDGSDAGRRRGYIFVPLQGRLLERRSFQTMSPIDMLKSTLKHDARRPVHIALHPRENYSRWEMDALNALIQAEPRLRLVTSDRRQQIRDCDYIVTQNSSLALQGFFYHKPAILFGRIDFCHIAANVTQLGVPGAFAQVRSSAPEFDAYLFWFLQRHSINAGREDAEDKILATVRNHGWTV